MKTPKRKAEESAYTHYRGCLIVKHSDSKYTTCRREFKSMQEAMDSIDAGYKAIAAHKKQKPEQKTA